MHGTEKLCYTFDSLTALDREQRSIHLRHSLACFGAEKLRVALRVHLPKDPLNGFEHTAWLERLHNEILRACLHRFRNESLLSHRTAHQPAGLMIDARDLSHCLDSAHLPTDDVHRNHVVLV